MDCVGGAFFAAQTSRKKSFHKTKILVFQDNAENRLVSVNTMESGVS